MGGGDCGGYFSEQHATSGIARLWYTRTERVVRGINSEPRPTLVVHFALMSHLDEVSQQLVGLSVGLLHLLELVSQSHTVGLQ